MPPQIPRTSILLTLLRGTPLECRLVVGSLSGSAQITQVHILILHEVLKLTFLIKRFVIFFFFSQTCVRHVNTFIFLVSTYLVLIKLILTFSCWVQIFVGVWFLHCHLEVHTTWGLKMAFLVQNGKGPNQSLLPPPKDLPKC